ncbi:TonB-dependent receptor [Pedobacter sp. ISL-68]|uniref:TonB-dependent receptor n=1 Tax=unclassified Pedobacter TaxID=2628915 RepID=UPI001BE64F3A|nr:MULTISPECIES: TonB-dependent receptor [unclassified Pedobacter]MBT2563741.1 TonB-dependent receptor [Pedobacter sp. ISL-64]MBT2589633.1 TonB-dependent receptor [Pedobacter sp. ISL-68]
MKFTVFLLFSLVFQVSASSFAQNKITLAEKNISLEKALEKISSQSGFDILYNSKGVKRTNAISINVKDATLNSVLDKCFSGQPLTYTIEASTIVVRERAVPNDDKKNKSINNKTTGDIKGKVIDEQGLGLPGATIKVKGTTQAVVTGDGGLFNLKNVEEGAILSISFVSYQTQEVKARFKDEMLIQLLAEAGSLNEVVVSAYGQTQKKISVTAAISTIQTRELKQSPVANLSNALAGRLPGLTSIQSSGVPGSDASTIYIRGIGTYGSATSPLIVIDGLPRGDANFGDIDVNEVASISILKDAAATSLYGIQGANGVILVTTKRGFIGKTNISFNANYGVQTPQRLQQKFSSPQKAYIENLGAYKDGLAPIWTDKELELFASQQDPYTYPDINWYDVIFKKYTPQQQYNTNINGGNEYVKYFVSLGYLNQGNLFKAADDNRYGIRQKYDRYNFRSNIDIKATDMMDVRVDLASRLEQRTGPGSSYQTVFTYVNLLENYTTPIFNPNGTYAAGRMTTSNINNPLGQTKDAGYFDNYWNSTNGTVEVNHKLAFITKGLSAKALYSFENYSAINYLQTQSFDAFRYKKDPVTGVETYTPFSQVSSLSKSYSTSANRYFNYNVQLNYNRSFAKNNFTGLALFNRNYTSVANDLPRTYEGFVGRLAYNYDSRYFVDFNVGYNGSENFPKGSRYGFFPAVSAGWVISGESWYKSKTVNLLKLRGSFGYVGNDQIGGARWLFITDYARGGGFDFGTSATTAGGYLSNRIGNPNVTWEKAQKMDIGIETGFFNNHLKFEADVFREDRKNILSSPLTIPTYLGITNPAAINVGRVLNKGFETSLNFNTAIDKVSVFGYVNWSYNKSKILERDEPNLAYPYQTLTGLPVGYQLGYQALGLFKNQAEIDASPKQAFAGSVIPGDIRFKDMNGDNLINENDRVAIQLSNFPFNTFGASLGASYKGIDFSVLFQGTMGGKTYVPYLGPARLNDVWTVATAETATYPVVHYSLSGGQNNAQLNTFFAYSSDYLKLKNIELGYTLPKSVLSKIKINTFRVFLSGLNLFTWDKLPYKDFDPEQTANGTALYPTQKIYNLGVSMTF